jgi:O-antigen/teichoic acid export membrane protein
MRKIVYITGVLAASNLLLSLVFKMLHLMGAPTLLLIGTFFGVLFIASAAWYKYQISYHYFFSNTSLERA